MKMSTKSLTFTALLAALICVLSPLSVSIGPIPLSFGSLAVYIAACLLDKKHGTLAVAVFIALGMVGVPVFSGYRGGFGIIAGLTGGYILGYLPLAFLTGVFVDKWEKHWWAYPLGMFVGTVALYTFGTAWFLIVTAIDTGSADFGAAMMACVVPFLIGDTVKIVATTALCFKLRFLIRKAVSADWRRKKKQPTEGKPETPQNDDRGDPHV